jgi:hypothetical protein
MKQPGVILTLLVFIAALSFVLAAQQKQNSRPLTARLSGVSQIAGDADGSGTAKILLNAAQSQLCYEVVVNNIATPSNITIFSNATSKLASFAIASESAKSPMTQCAVVEREKLMDIARNPASYFVSVQNTEYPNGALRGQLVR